MDARRERIHDSIRALDDFEKAMQEAQDALDRLLDLPMSVYLTGEASYKVFVQQERSSAPDRLQADGGDLLVLVEALGMPPRVMKRLDISGRFPDWMRKRGTKDHRGRNSFMAQLPGIPQAYVLVLVTPDRKTKGLLIEPPVQCGLAGLGKLLKEARVPEFDQQTAAAVERFKRYKLLDSCVELGTLKRSYEMYREKIAEFEEHTEPAPKRQRPFNVAPFHKDGQPRTLGYVQRRRTIEALRAREKASAFLKNLYRTNAVLRLAYEARNVWLNIYHSLQLTMTQLSALIPAVPLELVASNVRGADKESDELLRYIEETDPAAFCAHFGYSARRPAHSFRPFRTAPLLSPGDDAAGGLAAPVWTDSYESTLLQADAAPVPSRLTALRPRESIVLKVATCDLSVRKRLDGHIHTLATGTYGATDARCILREPYAVDDDLRPVIELAPGPRTVRVTRNSYGDFVVEPNLLEAVTARRLSALRVVEALDVTVDAEPMKTELGRGLFTAVQPRLLRSITHGPYRQAVIDDALRHIEERQNHIVWAPDSPLAFLTQMWLQLAGGWEPDTLPFAEAPLFEPREETLDTLIELAYKTIVNGAFRPSVFQPRVFFAAADA